MNNLLVMQNAQATQLDGIDGKSNWRVTLAGGTEQLFELDSALNEHQVMAAIKMARKYEKIAFMMGTKSQADLSAQELQDVKDRGQLQLDELNARISGLSSELLRLMGEEE